MDLNRILETGDRCIYDEPAACTAYCPVHVDVPAFMTEVQKGDFSKAYKVLEKKLPFARIICSICDSPCEKVCVRYCIDGAVKISELEKTAIKLGYSAPKKALQVPKTAGEVAVVGGGISGITAAFELNKKGFRVTIYEKSDKLGGRIWNYNGRVLEEKIINEELETMKRLGININLNSNVGKTELENIVMEFDAVYLGTGEWEDGLKINSETFQIEGTSIFAGGRLTISDNSVIFSVSSGKRAAISIERYVKKASLTAVREREGSFETPLKYNVEDIEYADVTEKASVVYNKDEAIKEAGRCQKCRCMECIKPCTHLKKFDISPKNYVRQINHNETVIMGTRYSNKMINSCTLCGLCQEQCGEDVNLKDIIQETRESMVSRGKMPPSAHDFALKDMEFSNSERFSLVRNQLIKVQDGELLQSQSISCSQNSRDNCKETEKAQYVFYPGCQLSASYPEYVEDSYKYLLSNIKDGVGLMLGCCGAPADWAGRAELENRNIEKIRNSWENLGRPTFILACSSCSSTFKKYMPEADIISLWEVFEKYGLPEGARKREGRVLNIHDACTTRHNSGIHKSIRNIAASLGYEIRELKYSKEKTKCCGYGGLVYYANREHSDEFVKDRINESTEDLLVYCSMCKDLFVRGGKRTYHILDLIFGKDMDNVATRKMPNLSERHINRSRLKAKLLKEMWGEEPNMDLTRSSEYNLLIPDEIWKVMEDRYILLEDVERVIDNSIKKKERFFNPKDSNYLARLRIENVTYWVKYEVKDEGILVRSVYSHRMEVVEE